MQGMTFDEANDLYRDHRHLVGCMVCGKEVTEIVIGPADKDTLFKWLDLRDNEKQAERILNAATAYEVYLLLDYDKYSRLSPAVALLRGVMHQITGE